MEQYNVTGMSCAACSARVEKAVSKVPGVNSCSVSLLTNSMGVEGTASSGEIIAAVEAAGYGASLKGGAAGAKISMSAAEEALEEAEETARSCSPLVVGGHADSGIIKNAKDVFLHYAVFFEREDWDDVLLCGDIPIAIFVCPNRNVAVRITVADPLLEWLDFQVRCAPTDLS